MQYFPFSQFFLKIIISPPTFQYFYFYPKITLLIYISNFTILIMQNTFLNPNFSKNYTLAPTQNLTFSFISSIFPKITF